MIIYIYMYIFEYIYFNIYIYIYVYIYIGICVPRFCFFELGGALLEHGKRKIFLDQEHFEMGIV